MIEITILGVPAPQGSKTRTKWGVREDNPRTKPWRLDVAAQAIEAMNGQEPIDAPVHVRARFVFPRPKSHYRTGRNAHLLRDDAPTWHTTKPDTDKLMRSIGDSLSSIVVRDDSRICAWTVEKVYGEPARCELEIAIATRDAIRTEAA